MSLCRTVVFFQDSANSDTSLSEVEENIASSSSASSLEDIVEATDPHDSLEEASVVHHNRKVQFRPKDVIVLEFGGSENKCINLVRKLQ